MLISIIIPVFNAEQYLDRCLTSILNQVYKNIEVIIIDDCSTDSSVSIIKKYQKADKRIRLIENQKNLLAGSCRNKGLHLSTGDFVWFVDADDWLVKTSVELIVDKLKLLKKTDVLVIGFTEHLTKTKQKKYLPREDVKTSEAFSCFLEIRKGFYSMPFVYIFNSTFLKSNNIGFQENVYFEDINFVAEALLISSETKVLPDDLYNYNKVNHNSITQSPSNKKAEDLILSYEKLKSLMEKNDVLNIYSHLLLNRFIIFGLSKCFRIYYGLTSNEKKQGDLRASLMHYKNSSLLSSRKLKNLLSVANGFGKNEVNTYRNYKSNISFLWWVKHMGQVLSLGFSVLRIFKK